MQLADNPKGILDTLIEDEYLTKKRKEEERQKQENEATEAKKREVERLEDKRLEQKRNALVEKEKIENENKEKARLLKTAEDREKQEKIRKEEQKERQRIAQAEKAKRKKEQVEKRRAFIQKYGWKIGLVLLSLVFIILIYRNCDLHRENDKRDEIKTPTIQLDDSKQVDDDIVDEIEPEKSTPEENYQNLIFDIQNLLNIKGYSSGKPDGVMGDNTRNAIIAFQEEKGVTNEEIFSELGLTTNLNSENKNKWKEELKRIDEIKEKEKSFQKYVKEGDSFYSQKNYNRAKLAYEKALKIKYTNELKEKIDSCTKTLRPKTNKPAPKRINPIIINIEKNMETIPAGTFTMGCKDGRDKNCSDGEKPAHKVSLSSFKMNKYEVTQEEWRAVMGSDPEELKFKGCDKCPVERVSWDDVQDFIKKLNKITGKKYRLPSEAEWEYAARGGEGYEYAGSNTIDDIAWYRDNSESKTHPVGEKKPNGFGLYDMTGNVWEWCEDGWHDDYKAAPTDGSVWRNDKEEYRMVRGGSWNFYGNNCRVSDRYYNNRSSRNFSLGFRLVRY